MGCAHRIGQRERNWRSGRSDSSSMVHWSVERKPGERKHAQESSGFIYEIAPWCVHRQCTGDGSLRLSQSCEGFESAMYPGMWSSRSAIGADEGIRETDPGGSTQDHR